VLTSLHQLPKLPTADEVLDRQVAVKPSEIVQVLCQAVLYQLGLSASEPCNRANAALLLRDSKLIACSKRLSTAAALCSSVWVVK